MSKINLLPWRDDLRKALNKVFFFELGKNIAFTILIVMMFDQYFSHRIDINNTDINYINFELQKMSPKVIEIQALQKRKLDLLNHITAIQNLQEDRFSIVKLMDIMPRVVPDYIYLTAISRQLNDGGKDKNKNAANNNVVGGNRRQPAKENNKPLGEVTRSKYLITIDAVSLNNSSIATFLKNLEEISWLSDVKLLEVSANKNGVGLAFKLQCAQSVGKEGI
jgi:Tfp pilus assembly protein PilN